ncbi:hypothetical protein ACLOJK_037387 [Asimina triloba]
MDAEWGSAGRRGLLSDGVRICWRAWSTLISWVDGCDCRHGQRDGFQPISIGRDGDLLVVRLEDAIWVLLWCSRSGSKMGRRDLLMEGWALSIRGPSALLDGMATVICIGRNLKGVLLAVDGLPSAVGGMGHHCLDLACRR